MKEFLHIELLHIGDYQIMVYHILALAGIFIGTKLILFITYRIFLRQIKTKSYDEGRSLAFYQIIKYVLIVAAIAAGLETMGIKLTLLLAGSAALLVGLGLGIQQFFNDLVSGLVLLIEGTVTVGDIVELDGLVGKITEINMRTSSVATRDNIMIIVPNSKLVGDNVINWSHNREATRFHVEVGVAYGTDLNHAERLILQLALKNSYVAKKPEPFTRFIEFGDSSLNLEVYFWTRNMWEIEFVKSEIRKEIYAAFNRENITIPFPQRDIHVHSNQKN
ncbi:mechanosensitive ion channel family protein [Reichenbachiella agariperforans]|uniref:mechanosensitive ion channel family protein n=1 Tax=Reichenbachiella agariperforans TaxID=156994 RepID=UPI001C08BE48|nr:mechanosensitive ion channel domain-containing protein [Reichenbachiella agariperforans]MBU2916306.1 mechanosensitive ion channel [Reichenbachiella agariperforans]